MGLKRDKATWDLVLQQISKAFGMETVGEDGGDGSLLATKPPWFLHALDDDLDLERVEYPALEFSHLQVEPLLNQAADLLDRALADRRDWNELRRRACLQWIELAQFLAVDAIHQDEEQAGAYGVPHARAAADLEAARLSMEPLETAHRLATERTKLDLNPDAMKDQVALMASAAYVNAAPATLPKKGYGWHTPDSKVDWESRTFEWAGPTASGPLGSTKSRISASHEAELASRALNQERRTAEAHNARALMEKLRADADVSALETEEAWERANIKFKTRRSQASRDGHDMRAREASRPGGAMNDIELMGPIRDRFRADFVEAKARIRAVRAGLRVLFGYNVGEPEWSLDDTVTWTRAAINWLVRFSQFELNAVLPVSLATSLEDAEWERGLADGHWRFVLGADLLPETYHVRLRGLSAFVECGQENVLWRVDCRVPEQSWARHHPKIAGERLEVEVEQSHLPWTTCFRAASRTAEWAADVSGVNALHNAAPFGTWTVKVPQAAANSKILRTSISDVQLDLHLAFLR